MRTMLPMPTRRPRLPGELPPLRLKAGQRACTHMLASLLLDYPDAAWFARLPSLRTHLAGLPAPIAEPLAGFMDAAELAGQAQWEEHYVLTFDLKRKCSLYLSYFSTGDTRRRGVALLTFLDAYRAAGWQFDAQELPDYLPAVLELSALSGSEVAAALITSHREGVELLRAALEDLESPWAHVVRTITLSLPPVDDRTRERFRRLVDDGPPTETVGLSLGLEPFVATSQNGADG